MSRRQTRWLVAAGGGLSALLFLVVTVNSLSWIGRTFPGMMVMANRVIPSVALSHWSDGRTPELFQHQIVAIDDTPVASARSVREAVRGKPAGTTFAYEMRDPTGERRSVRLPSQIFSRTDYLSLFGTFLLNGLVFMAIGFLVLWVTPTAPASAGLAATSLITGLFVTTAVDLYGPSWFFRLHVLAEAFMGAAFAHLALVFPTDRLGRGRGRILRWLYGGSAMLAVFYELVLWNPGLYTLAHLWAVGFQVAGCVAMIVAFVHDYVRSGSALVRRRVQVVTLGVVAGMLGPACVWATSAALGGAVSMNGAALTAFLFPLSFAYAVLQQDLFEIDVVLRRAVTYTLVVVATVTIYVAVLGTAEWTIGARAMRHPVLLVGLNLGLLFALSPIRDRVREFVDSRFFRRGYDAQATVQRLGNALESARQTSQVIRETREVLRETFWARDCVLLSRPRDAWTALPDQGDDLELVIPPEAHARLARGEVLARYEWDDGAGREPPAPWAGTSAELIVPVLRDERLEYVLALGRKESGRAYNAEDSALLRTMAGQISLAMATARAFGELEDLNVNLERQVEERTRELAVANSDLRASLDRLNEAYAKLEQNQTSLLRADRLATLGRLAAGIAHEVNTPLGAVLNSLEILDGLGREYEESIEDAGVTPADHAEIAKEIQTTIGEAKTWADRAATYIRRVKGHGRDAEADESRRFALATVFADVAGLLGHRLRAGGCRLDYDADSAAVELVGDPSRLGHVLMNVIDNAIGAYEEQDAPDGRIELRAVRVGDTVYLGIRDYAGGIPPDVAERVFEELFTTKERGKGTGLGLWIARNVAERSFRGALDLVPVDGPGTGLLAVLRDDDPRGGWAASSEPREGENDHAPAAGLASSDSRP